MPDLVSPEEFASDATGLNLAGGDGFNNWLVRQIAPGQQEQYWQMYNDQVNRIYNATEAEKTRAWQQMMSETSIQRMMKDAEKAGINPYYVVSNGNGASPGGASASSSGSSYNAQNGKSVMSTIMTLVMLFAKILALG